MQLGKNRHVPMLMPFAGRKNCKTRHVVKLRLRIGSAECTNLTPPETVVLLSKCCETWE